MQIKDSDYKETESIKKENKKKKEKKKLNKNQVYHHDSARNQSHGLTSSKLNCLWRQIFN